MKPTPSRLRSAHSSPAVSTRDIRAGGENTPSAKRPLAGRAVSIGSTSLSSIHATLPSPPRDDIMATPRPAGSASDIERRKSHLLATLQLTAQRSQNRAKLNKGAATPLRNNLSSIIDGTSSEGGSSAAGSGVSGASNSTNDLNPHANSNHSLPLGDRSTRFNGAKLNSYLHSLNTHLTEENQQLSDALQSRDAEIQELRAALEEGHQGGQTADHTSSSTGSLSRSQRRREVELLQEQLQTRSDEVADLRDELLQVQSGPDGTPKRLQKEVFELKDKLRAATEANDEQLLTLEEKDKELEEVQADFSTKMKRLEDELCAVMEEQEGQLEEALQGNEQLRSENKELHDSQEKLQHELETVSSERDRLADALHSNDDQPTKGSAARLQFLEADVARLKETIDEIELEKKKLQQSNEELEEREEQLADSEQSMKNVLAARDAELAASRQQLDKTLQDNKNIERSLRAQLDSLQRQAGERQLDRVDKAARDDLKDQEIAHLSQAKADLETRVSSLRQQIDVLSAVNEAADKTMAFKPIIGVQTPKTPGYFRAVSFFS